MGRQRVMSTFVSWSTLLLLVCHIMSSSSEDCIQPPVVPNAEMQVSSFTPGSTVTYNCTVGYQNVGSMQKICRNGTWQSSGSPPSCRTLYCPTPSRVDHASFRAVSRSFGSGFSYRSSYRYDTIVQYNCYSGYTLATNSSQISCLANMTWSQPLPYCKRKECGAPPMVEFANVTAPNKTYGSGAVYKCSEGYTLVTPFGSRSRPSYSVSCLSTGRWASTPRCDPKDCGTPPVIAHGLKLSGRTHLFSDTVIYECETGYRVHGNSVITCTASGNWSPAPQCTAVVCSNPPTIENGRITSTTTVTYGNNTYYSCDTGYRMSGLPYITCLADGNWTSPSSCMVIDCREPPSIHYGSYQYNSTTFNSKAIYTCADGYKLIGTATVMCRRHAAWSRVPSCERPPDYTPAAPATAAGQTSLQTDSSSAVTSIAIACALFGVITLLCILILGYKIFQQSRTALFSYASYKNGDDGVNASI